VVRGSGGALNIAHGFDSSMSSVNRRSVHEVEDPIVLVRNAEKGNRMTMEIVTLTERDIEARLRELEIAFSEFSGMFLSSSDFYDRYRTGEHDTPFGAVWATYCEAYARIRTGARSPVAA
jgi:hypothetical protein